MTHYDPSIDRLWNKAQLYMDAGNTAVARDVLEALLQQQPRHSAAHMTLSHIAWADDRVRDAARHALAVAKVVPNDSTAVIAVAMALLRVGEVVATRKCLEHSALTQTDRAFDVMHHIGLRRQLGEDVEALALLDRAQSMGVDGAEFRFARGLELLICGYLKEAEADLETSLRMDATAAAAALELARLRKRTQEDNHLADFNGRLQQVRQGTMDHAALQFARYKELEDLEHYDDAWNALSQANFVMHGLHPWEPDHSRRQANALMRACGAHHAVHSGASDLEGPSPIFVFGLPRSGTTLLDRLLGAHSQVVSAGELDDFGLQMNWAADTRETLSACMLERLPDLDYAETGRRYLAQTQWRAHGARFYIDKQPWNHTVAGLIHRALPQARLLHLTRDPMDICFSNFRAMLGARYAWSNDFEGLAEHYKHYRRLHEYWRTTMPDGIKEVSYRDLVTHTDTTLREVLDFCGLPWEPGCLETTRNSGPVGTLSAAQVRGPIHAGAFAQWKRYEKQLEPLRQLLDS